MSDAVPDGVGDSVGVGVSVGVGDSVGVGVSVTVTVSVGVGVGVSLGGGSSVGVPVGVSEGLSLAGGVSDGVSLGVRVGNDGSDGVRVGEKVTDPVGVGNEISPSLPHAVSGAATSARTANDASDLRDPVTPSHARPRGEWRQSPVSGDLREVAAAAGLSVDQTPSPGSSSPNAGQADPLGSCNPTIRSPRIPSHG
ncbi:hypothetical protein GCM10023146_14370 [Nocardioides caricicola]